MDRPPITPDHVEQAGEQVRQHLEEMSEMPVDGVSDEVLGQDLQDRWEALLAEAGVDRPTARALLYQTEDVLPARWRGVGSVIGFAFFQAGVAVGLLARQLADESEPQQLSSRPASSQRGAG
jgi:hypothetical protein